MLSINKLIKKVNNEITCICTANGFHFISKDIISVSIIWKDGLHVINNFTEVSVNGFLKYLNILLQIVKKIMD